MDFASFSKNGQILPIAEAVVPISNIEYSYGFGVYETVKVRKSTVYFVEQHSYRLMQSAELIGLIHPFTKEKVETYIKDLVEKLQIVSCNLKVILIGSQKSENVMLYIIPLSPLFPDRKLYKQGAQMISVNYARWYPKAKSLNMLPSYIAYSNARQAGVYDGLLVDKEGFILEGTRTNFYVINGNHITMAPLDKVLEGVTLDTVLHVARKNGYTVVEKDYTIADLSSYEGAFLTSTSSKIIPVKQIDDFVFPEIPETVKNLMKLYDDFLDQCEGKFL